MIKCSSSEVIVILMTIRPMATHQMTFGQMINRQMTFIQMTICRKTFFEVTISSENLDIVLSFYLTAAFMQAVNGGSVVRSAVIGERKLVFLTTARA